MWQVSGGEGGLEWSLVPERSVSSKSHGLQSVILRVNSLIFYFCRWHTHTHTPLSSEGKLRSEETRESAPLQVCSMLRVRGHGGQLQDYLHPLQPPTHNSAIELDAKKSPLALLAQTCSQIGNPDPPSSSKTPTGSKEFRSAVLKISDIGAEDRSGFKPYLKSPEKSGQKGGFRVPIAPGRSPSPGASSLSSPRRVDCPAGDREEEKETERVKASQSEGSGSRGSSVISSEPRAQQQEPKSSSDAAVVSSVTSALGSGLVAPVSPFRPSHSVFPLSPAFPGLAGAYSSYPQHFFPQGLSLDPAKQSTPLISAHLSAKALSGASPCRDPYCLSYHCHLQTSHDSSVALKYPLLYPSHPLPGVPSSTLLYPYSLLLPGDPPPHICSWVSSSGPCEKRFSSPEELLSHLRTHTAFAGTEKSTPGFPGSPSLAAVACHMHIPPGGSPLALRTPHHTLGLGRYHPYPKSPLQTPTMASYYTHYGPYGQRLTTASGLSYQ
ncbi:zinc finger protein 503-like [Hoplias malabaricus]|uniref:zinc finger protein 503-like n=1 Tax=Hoplias malabaricus TaxID=27720 RepID=UPI00346355CE